MNEQKTITIECPDCKGTGLYVGCAERDGAAVVCYMCNGTGQKEYKYREFTGRNKRSNVKRVFRPSNYVIGADDIVNDEGVTLHFSRYGCTYEEWLNGADPKPMEELVCPYMHDNRGMGNEPCSRCARQPYTARINQCRYFSDKANCWKEYHANKYEGIEP